MMDMQKYLFRMQQILFYIFVIVSLLTLVLSLAFMTDFKVLFDQPYGVGTFHDDVLQVYNRAIFNASIVMVIGAFIVSVFDFRKAISDYLGLIVLGILSLFNVYKSFIFLSQIEDMTNEYLALNFEDMLLAANDVYEPTTRTFELTRMLYMGVIVVTLLFLVVSVINTVIYYLKQGKELPNE